MAEQGQIAIRDKLWLVDIALTDWELLQGLKGVMELPAGAGMLFDLRWEQLIGVTTEGCLINLDIAFLDGNLVVTEVVPDVAPGKTFTSTLPARFFLEVNSGELAGIVAGDPAILTITKQDWVATIWNMAMTILPFIILGSFGIGMVKMATGEPEKPRALTGPVRTRYSRPYLTNWQYGGYSTVEEDPRKRKELWVTGMSDYVNPDEVIRIAEREGMSEISLAGGFWQEIGYKGWGETVSIAEAKVALKKGKEIAVSPQRPLLDPYRFPQRTEALKKLGRYDIVRIHDDGDLTVRSEGKLYLVTIEGQTFAREHHSGNPLPFTPEEYFEWKEKFEAGYGQVRPGVSAEQAKQERAAIPRAIRGTYIAEKYLGREGGKAEHSSGSNIVIPKLPEAAQGDVEFYHYIRDLSEFLGWSLNEEEARWLWSGWEAKKKRIATGRY